MEEKCFGKYRHQQTKRSMILEGFRDTRARTRGVLLISRSILQGYFGGRNERIETDLVQSRKQKKERFSINDGSAHVDEYTDV